MPKLYQLGIICLCLFLCAIETFAQTSRPATLLEVADKGVASGLLSARPLPVNLVDQQPNQLDGIRSDLDFPQIAFDNFMVSSSIAIDELTFWGSYFPMNQIPPSGGTFTINLYNDVAGQPDPAGPFVVRGPINLTGAPTGATIFGVDELVYNYSFNPSVTFTMGNTYWISIVNNTVGNTDDWFWEAGNLDTSSGIADHLYSQTDPPSTYINLEFDLAFRLTNSILPVELSSFQSSVDGNDITLD